MRASVKKRKAQIYKQVSVQRHHRDARNWGGGQKAARFMAQGRGDKCSKQCQL